MESSPTDRAPTAAIPRPPLLALRGTHVVVWLLVTGSTALGVARYWLDADHRKAALNGPLLLESTKDSTPLLAVLLLAPLVWWAGRFRDRPAQTSDAPSRRIAVDVLCAIVVGIIAMAASRWYGQPFDGLPPAIHDEYSYLFQAQTFLDGRTWLPSFPEHPELFDQMHVLNEGKFASRYFPGTGLWLAAFERDGNPWEGQWMANGLIASGLFVVGRMLTSRAAGILAALLYAAAPGMLIFSNMLVAHMPTMLGLTAFLIAILRCRERATVPMALVAGCGLAFAMICRPMTAAGFALPFGIDWLWRLTRSRQSSLISSNRPSFPATIALGLPLVAGAAGLLAYNQSITGKALESPYQLYTDLYTPRHVYGFNNVVRGEKNLGPKVNDHYDRWAENLTPSLALSNVKSRLLNSTAWCLGFIPMLLAALVTLLDWPQVSAGWRLIVASILSLHVVHIPYWWDGIMGWHYVFESGPLLLLLFTRTTIRLAGIWRSWAASRLILWWGALIGCAVLVNDVSIAPLWESRLAISQREAMFSRGRLGLFRIDAEELAKAGPIVVFVKPDPSDRHLDYVTNRPTLDGPVLVARETATVPLSDARKLFPERRAFEFDAAKRTWRALE